MTRLEYHRSALLAVFPDVSDEVLVRTVDERGGAFVSFVIDHGLGPLWNERTGRAEFHESRLQAEALFGAQEHALKEIDALLGEAGIEYAVFKGASDRLLLYGNPAIRACHDIDILVRREDRVKTAKALGALGFTAVPDALNIGHELAFSRGVVDIDLHWTLLRDGRLRSDCTDNLLSRRRRVRDIWMLHADDEFFVLLVHSAFAKHLAAWVMGLHRVADIVVWSRTQPVDWQAVRTRLEEQGVRTAAWATLRWVQLLAGSRPLTQIAAMIPDVIPGPLRQAWLGRWLREDLSERTASVRWTRLLGFSTLLHDTPHDAVRAFAGRRRAHCRQSADLAAFRELLGQ
jgi:hypothetical protein